jgi:hypothetical protein
VVVTYFLGEDLGEGFSVALEFVDAAGQPVRRFEPEPPGREQMSEEDKAYYSGPWITAKPGINRFVWDLRYQGATKVVGNKLSASASRGPLVVPGSYEARLVLTEAGGENRMLSARFEVRNDPRSGASQSELEDQLAAVLEIRDQISRLHEAVITIRSLKKQLAHWQERSDLGEGARAAAADLEQKLHEIEDRLMVPGEHKDTFGLNEPARLSQKLASVIAVFTSADARPTKSAREVAAKYIAAIEEQLDKLDQVVASDLAEFNATMAQAGLSAVHA